MCQTLPNKNPSKYKSSDCPRCGKSFTCFLFKHCPCEELEIPEDALEYIQLKYGECICIHCLREMIEEYKQHT